MELLCRDVMKRLRDEHTRKDPRRKQNSSGTARTQAKTSGAQSKGVALAAQALAATRLPPSQAPIPSQVESARNQPGPASNVRLAGINDYSDLQIDPKLLLAANDPSPGLTSTMPTGHYSSKSQPSRQLQHHQPLSYSQAQPIYFRLSPLSPIQQEPKVWLATLAGADSVENLRSLALTSHGHLPMQNSLSVITVEGLVLSSVDGIGQGAEMRYPIDEDDELQAYLQHVKGGKATFRVQFVEQTAFM